MNRKRNHRTNYKNHKNKNYNSLIYIAMRNYGIENFVFDFLEKCEISELNDKERHYIKIYTPTYNQTPGGKGGHVNQPKEFDKIVQDLQENKLAIKEIAVKYGYSIDTIININYGKTWKKENLSYPIRKRDLKLISRKKFSKPVCQFDLEGNFIKEWSDPISFLEEYGRIAKPHNAWHIYQVCKGKRKTAYGFIWKYKE